MRPFRRPLRVSGPFLYPLLIALTLHPAAWGQPQGDDKPWSGKYYAVATAHPLATDAAYAMLRAGGSAMDAAIAAQMVLTLVEPQASGIGGGAFLLHHDGKITESYDGRETAPSDVDEDLFLDAQRKPMGFAEASVGGRAVGTPGLLRMLELAHGQHGRLPWKQLFEPAITLAEQGFPVSPRLHMQLAEPNSLRQDPVAAAYFFDSAGQPWPVGHKLRNPELAAVLRRVANAGANAFYLGEKADDIAPAIVRKVREHARNPGHLSLADLADYEALVRAPLCFVYQARSSPDSKPRKGISATRDVQICGMPPPSSGTLALGQIFGILARTPAASMPMQRKPPRPLAGPLPSAQWLHLYAEAARLAMADRALYVADPDYVPPPGPSWMALLEPDYLAERAKLVNVSPGTPRMKEVPAGIPMSVERNSGDQGDAPYAGLGHHSRPPMTLAPMPTQPEYGTSHISIVDGQGHALAMTSSVEAVWGAQVMVNRGQGLVGGFLLNNQLTDFSFVPRGSAGTDVVIANRVEPRKRPRSSMTPLLIFSRPRGELLFSGGSPGGASIIHYTGKMLYGVLHWGLDVQQAINLPNFAVLSANEDGPVLLEQGRFPPSTVQALRQRGHPVREQALNSGLQAIELLGQGLQGGADPRREGTVRGE
ncbi:gamma-glutamyltransferase family protein [Hylemonella gracilis]|uniref:Gamma-glutamyltransferase n=1 Tax=Hylemonella gracilis ATCC 19624 TaxID=887062 RepID=F3KPF0_9BURK|nr:gamma-glutamyltransferase family protein [Hylemonella gracilis]EGI78391.1 gamma-glutamyltransferase [Hylemonella gracilis ATCC 19624]